MTTTNLFVIANVKQLRTWVVLEFYCLFSEHLGVLASYIQQFLTVFSSRVEFGTILEGLRNFGGRGLNTPNPPLGTPLPLLLPDVVRTRTGTAVPCLIKYCDHRVKCR